MSIAKISTLVKNNKRRYVAQFTEVFFSLQNVVVKEWDVVKYKWGMGYGLITNPSIKHKWGQFVSQTTIILKNQSIQNCMIFFFRIRDTMFLKNWIKSLTFHCKIHIQGWKKCNISQEFWSKMYFCLHIFWNFCKKTTKIAI